MLHELPEHSNDGEVLRLLERPPSPLDAQASAAVDAKYRGSFPGYRSAGREQGLEWPRQVAYDRQGWLISDTIVPIEVASQPRHTTSAQATRAP